MDTVRVRSGCLPDRNMGSPVKGVAPEASAAVGFCFCRNKHPTSQSSSNGGCLTITSVVKHFWVEARHLCRHCVLVRGSQ